MEGVGVDRLFKCLAEEVLAALGVGDVAEDREGEVVGDQALGGGEEAEVAQDDQALVRGEAGAFPEGDVGAHRHLVGHPVVGAAVEVVLPGPLVLERHELVDVDGLAVDQALCAGDGVLGLEGVEIGEGEGHFDDSSVGG
jgi:hypothetical protein